VDLPRAERPRERRFEQHGADSFDSPGGAHERDGHFGDRELSGGDKQHLDEKRVAIGDETIERHGGGLAPPASVAARACARSAA
jgi:hypothetical protein